MDARLSRAAAALAAIVCVAASYRTPNFVVEAPTAEMAQRVAEAAEQYRKDLALQWLGREMPRWASPCPVRVKLGPAGPGGATTFACSHGEVYNWNMVVEGSLERIITSVLPHEINHTVLASHFRRPMVRWADEGAATLVEDSAEKARQQQVLRRLISRREIIPLRSLLSLKEYPSDVGALYSQGYSLTHYLVDRGGHAKFLAFLADGQRGGWEGALERHYDLRSVAQLEQEWLAWIEGGSQTIGPAALASRSAVSPKLLAAGGKVPGEALLDVVIRGQNPDTEAALASMPQPESKLALEAESRPEAATSAGGTAPLLPLSPTAEGPARGWRTAGRRNAADDASFVPIETGDPRPFGGAVGQLEQVPSTPLGRQASEALAGQSPGWRRRGAKAQRPAAARVSIVPAATADGTGVALASAVASAVAAGPSSAAMASEAPALNATATVGQPAAAKTVRAQNVPDLAAPPARAAARPPAARRVIRRTYVALPYSFAPT